MKKLTIPHEQRAIELLLIIVALYCIRGIWELLGYWNYNEYFRFEMLRILFTTIILIKVLGFIRKKITEQLKVRNALMYIRIVEGVYGAFSILAVGTYGYIDYSVKLMVIAVIRWLIYIYALFIMANSKYNKLAPIRVSRYFLISMIAVDGALMSIGFIMAFTSFKELITIQWFLYCIPMIVLMFNLKIIKKHEEEPNQQETPEWKPE